VGTGAAGTGAGRGGTTGAADVLGRLGGISFLLIFSELFFSLAARPPKRSVDNEPIL